MRLLEAFSASESPVALMATGDGRFVDVNPAFERITGYAREQVIGRVPVEIGLWSDLEFRAQLWESLSAERRIVAAPTPLRCADGKVLSGRLHVEFVRDAGESRLFGLVQVLPEDHAQIVSTRNESLYRGLFLSAAEGIYRSLPNGGFLDANPAMARILGYESPAQLLLAFSARARDIYVDQAADERDSRVLMKQDHFEQNRVQVYRRDGSAIWVSENARVIRDAEGAPLFIEGSLEDITAQVESEQALWQSQRLYRDIFEDSPVGLFRTGLEGEILEINETLARMLGFRDPEQLKSRYQSMLEVYANPEERQVLVQRAIRDGSFNQYETQVLDIHGNRRWVSASVRLVRDEQGQPQFFSGSAMDIQERREMQQALVRSETRYRTLVEDSHVGVFIMNRHGLVYVNRSLAQMLGVEEHELLRSDYRNLLVPELRQEVADIHGKFQQTGELPGDFESCLLHASGQRVHVRISVSRVEIDGSRHASGTVLDITRQREAELRLRFHATHDALTGLPNRSLFNLRLSERLQPDRSGEEVDDSPYAVLFLDLDGFKWVNDSLGHGAGDRLLLEIARRLENELINEVMIARYGGDEFTLMPEGPCNGERAVAIARRVLSLFERPFDIGGQQVFSAVSIGIVLGRPDYESPDQVLRDADNAMYRAKAAGKSGFVVFDEGMHAEARLRLRMETDFRLAFEHGEFALDYQPINNLDSGLLVAVEALVRWRHPLRGVIPPSQFLPLAEETGLITELDRWVLREACRQLGEWRRRRPDWHGLVMNVNVDERQVGSPQIHGEVAGLLDAHDLPASCLRLEITETVFRSGSGFAQNQLVSLKELGVGLAVDDFGTGYSSLEAFAASPFDALKIDQSFVRDIAFNPRHRAIVKTVIGFAKDLGLLLTAEGIETEEQRQLLLSLGCQFGQGFLFARPLSPDEFEQRL